MIIVVLIVAGLIFGSFVNALVWRVHKQSLSKKIRPELSVISGRSMCPNCQHKLVAKDLIPVLSWISLGGKCRYCQKPISLQYPAIELLTAGLFVFSYLFWPYTFNGLGIFEFLTWLVFIVGFLALAIYDIRWMLLPNRIIYPLLVLAIVQVIIVEIFSHQGLRVAEGALWGLLIGGGVYYCLFQLSAGKWIGGGDVRLGALLGVIVGGPLNSIFLIFCASCIGSMFALPLMLQRKATVKTKLPFGPFLLLAAVITGLFGSSILAWYKRLYF